MRVPQSDALIPPHSHSSDFHVRNPQINVYTPDASKAADIDRADLSAKGYTTMMSVLDVRPFAFSPCFSASKRGR
jgi:hypothetical protein